MWPPFGLSITARDDEHEITLRVLRDEDICAIHGVTPEEIYGPDVPVYAFPWLFAAPSPAFRWAHRAEFGPEKWSLDLGVFYRNQIIGVVDMRAEDFKNARAIETGSWLYHREQGKGLGTLVRHAVAGFAFRYLEATSLHTSWVEGNAASERVSAKVGYTVTGESTEPSGPQKQPMPTKTARLDRDSYQPGARVVATGLTFELRTMLGVQ